MISRIPEKEDMSGSLINPRLTWRKVLWNDDIRKKMSRNDGNKKGFFYIIMLKFETSIFACGLYQDPLVDVSFNEDESIIQLKLHTLEDLGGTMRAIPAMACRQHEITVSIPALTESEATTAHKIELVHEKNVYSLKTPEKPTDAN